MRCETSNWGKVLRECSWVILTATAAARGTTTLRLLLEITRIYRPVQMMIPLQNPLKAKIRIPSWELRVSVVTWF